MRPRYPHPRPLFDTTPAPDITKLRVPPASRIGFRIRAIRHNEVGTTPILMWYSDAGSWNPQTGSLWSGADALAGVFDVGMVVGMWGKEIEGRK